MIFQENIFVLLYFINLPNFIFWLSLLLEIFNDMIYIAVICYPVCDIKNFEIKLAIFLLNKKVRTKFSIFQEENSF